MLINQYGYYDITRRFPVGSLGAHAVLATVRYGAAPTMYPILQKP